MKIIIGSDHAGFELKTHVVEWLKQNNYDFFDYGVFSKDSVDYPDIAYNIATLVSKAEYTRGIIICGTGIGVCITANKVKGIRAALCNDIISAELSRKHNDANILNMGGRLVTPTIADRILEIWLSTEFEKGRHQTRLDKISFFESM